MNHRRGTSTISAGQSPVHKTIAIAIAMAALILAASPLQAQAALPPGSSVLSVQATFLDGKLSASVEGLSPLPCPELASVFADFESMSAFVPGLASSRIVSSGPGWAVIQQSGSLNVGPFSQAFASERKIILDLPSRIDSSSTGRPGEPQLSASTTFSAEGAGCRARYATQVDLPAWAPGSFAESVAKSNAAIQMAAMLREAHRRHGALGASPAPRGAEHPGPGAKSAAPPS